MCNEFASERISINPLLEQLEPYSTVNYKVLGVQFWEIADKLTWFSSQANVVLKEKETFIEYLQKQLEETKNKLDSEVCVFLSVEI